jgi:rhodanese-related sulfurtransferase
MHIVDGDRMQTPAEMTMGELLARYPWAQRALFQKFHIGGCASCGFSDSESLADVCARSGDATPEKVLQAVHEAHEQDEAMMISPEDYQKSRADFTALDIRTSEEFEAVKIPGSRHFDQTLMSEIMASWPKDRGILIVDHTGGRSLDAAAYFAGHGFSNVRCLRGGIDAYSESVDPSLPRYTLEAA